MLSKQNAALLSAIIFFIPCCLWYLVDNGGPFPVRRTIQINRGVWRPSLGSYILYPSTLTEDIHNQVVYYLLKTRQCVRKRERKRKEKREHGKTSGILEYLWVNIASFSSTFLSNSLQLYLTLLFVFSFSSFFFFFFFFFFCTRPWN